MLRGCYVFLIAVKYYYTLQPLKNGASEPEKGLEKEKGCTTKVVQPDYNFLSFGLFCSRRSSCCAGSDAELCHYLLGNIFAQCFVEEDAGSL